MTTEDKIELPETFLSKVEFPFGLAESAARDARHEGLRPVADAFWKNIESAMNLLQLPHSLLMYAHFREKRSLVFLDVYVPLANKGMLYDNAEVKKRVDDEVSKRLKEWNESEATREMCHESDKTLAGLLESDTVQRQIRMLLISLISVTWTAFEVLAGDAWQLALNLEPNRTAEAVLKQFFPGASAEGISAKAIPMWLAAKYRFDLREHIGDILRARIDFSDVSETRKAYLSAFGDQPDLLKVLEDKNLSVLAATRHLVVHRAAIVDEKYNKVTGMSLPLCQPLALEPEFVSSILHPAIAGGSTIIKFLDDWLLKP